MTENERVTIPYLTVRQVADMAGFKSLKPVYEACNTGELKVIGKKPKDAQRWERKLDPNSVHFWLEERKLHADKYAAEQRAKEERKAARLAKKAEKNNPSDTEQLNRIEEKLDKLIQIMS